MSDLATYNFAYLDEQTKRMIRRAILKAVAIPGYQVPFAHRILSETGIPTAAVGMNRMAAAVEAFQISAADLGVAGAEAAVAAALVLEQHRLLPPQNAKLEALLQHGPAALRFFTVNGPCGRPDMSNYNILSAIFEGKPIDVYNHGNLRRDFTYVDDLVDAVMAVAAQPPLREDGRAPHRVLNVGHNGPVPLMDFIGCLEQACGRVAIKNYLPMQPGDVPDTWADTTRLEQGFGVRADTDLQVGVQRFVDWFRGYYGISPDAPPASGA